MDQDFDRAANDSPRSGGSKRVTPIVWVIVIVVVIAIVIWFTLKS
jgi:hypothetical protein